MAKTTPLMRLVEELRQSEERTSFNAVAERSGVSTSHLTKMGNGSREMDFGVARKLAAAYPAFAERIFESAEPETAFRPLAAFLEPEEVDWLEAEAALREVQPGVILREAVREYRDRREE